MFSYYLERPKPFIKQGLIYQGSKNKSATNFAEKCNIYQFDPAGTMKTDLMSGLKLYAVVQSRVCFYLTWQKLSFFFFFFNFKREKKTGSNLIDLS